MLDSQKRQQELMSEEDDYIIYDGKHQIKEKVDMTGFFKSISGFMDLFTV